MGTKLTLLMDEKLIRTAKKAAILRRVSLSRMVSDYFKSLLTQQKKELRESPVLSEIAGILSARKTKTDNKKLLASYRKRMERKYL